MNIGIISNWHEDCGYIDSEVEYVNYFKKKKFVIYATEIIDEEMFIELIKIQLVMQNYKIGFFKMYTFQDRAFCNINYSFLHFQKKCKKYYKNKLDFYKNPRNLYHRQLYGY